MAYLKIAVLFYNYRYTIRLHYYLYFEYIFLPLDFEFLVVLMHLCHFNYFYICLYSLYILID